MLEEYISDNSITVDEETTYDDLKSQINWEESKIRMKKYIDLFKDK